MDSLKQLEKRRKNKTIWDKDLQTTINLQPFHIWLSQGVQMLQCTKMCFNLLTELNTIFIIIIFIFTTIIIIVIVLVKVP